MINNLAGSLNTFSLNMHKEMSAIHDNNFVFSPFSVYNAMTMVLLGAAGIYTHF